MSVSNSRTTEIVDYQSAVKAAAILRALNHKLRQQIIRLLAENERMNVTDIYVKLRLEQSVCSQQLRILRDAHVVIADRVNKQIFYSVDAKQMNRMGVVIENFISESEDWLPE